MLKRLLHSPFLKRLELQFKNENLSLHKVRYFKYNLTNSSLFHTSSVNRIIVVSNENDYAFSVVNKVHPIHVTNKNLGNQEVKTEEEFNNILNQNWRVSSASEIVETFKNVKNFCIKNNINISDNRFDNLVDGVMDNCEHLSKDEITDLLSCMVEMPVTESYQSHNFHDLWSCLDDICCWKVVDWDVDTSLQVAKLWYKLNVGMYNKKLCDVYK